MKEKSSKAAEGIEIKYVTKRDGRVVPYDRSKITNAIFKAAKAVGGSDYSLAESLSLKVENELKKQLKEGQIPDIEMIQDIVEKVLIFEGHAKTAKAYIIYRVMHAKMRAERTHLKGSHAVPLHIQIDEKACIDYLKERHPKLARMFTHESKVKQIIDVDLINSYLNTLVYLKKLEDKNELPMHAENNYLGGNELANNIYEKKYYLKDLLGTAVEKRPEDVFVRIAAFAAAVEQSIEDQKYWAHQFYNDLYEGFFLPGGRVIAGAGDLYRLKTLANCFASEIRSDSIEDIYAAAYNCARTYSYGGGIGIDISVLRPKDAIVHNASTKSTGSVSFMELYSLTTGLIGQSGRRGALMLTLDVKHPDVIDFILCKRQSNWITKQIVLQCSWSGLFSDKQLNEIEKQVRENTQIRFANISVKVSDEFMQAVEEETIYGKDKILVYKQLQDDSNINTIQDFNEVHYSRQIPSKDLSNYQLIEVFDNIQELNNYLLKYNKSVSEKELNDEHKRSVFGDFIVELEKEKFNLAIKYAGDFMLYFHQRETGEIKKLVKARYIWNALIESNYSTAEPGLIFWSTMKKFSPSDYVGVPIITTNPCSEVPLENGGSCNLSSLNLSRFIVEPYTKNARIDWSLLEKVVKHSIRFLDNIASWNERLNALKEQRTAVSITRRIGLGIMGIADMLNQLGIPFDSNEGIALIEEVISFIANLAYQTSAMLAEEKGPFPLFNYEKYSRNPFFQQALTKHTQEQIKKHGLRNVALLSIAPTGTISNIVLSYKENNTNYIGVSSGIEPIFSLFYTRRSESFGNKKFKVFHSTVKAYIDKFNLNQKIDVIEDLDELRKVLPSYFFRTAHFIDPKQRIKIQAVCQKYVDHSISSTANLPESISPETISDVYIDAWKHGLKGITIYRDGSRFPILEVQKIQEEFQSIKNRKFTVVINNEKREVLGSSVLIVNDRLTTVYHLLKEGIPENIKVFELLDDGTEIPVLAFKEKKALKGEEKAVVSGSKACKIKFVDGKHIKECEE